MNVSLNKRSGCVIFTTHPLLAFLIESVGNTGFYQSEPSGLTNLDVLGRLWSVFVSVR